jgi:Zn finger protein HypA/HybF involved in hydrogenase expression
MTSPIEKIEVLCEKCGNIYEDWHRVSINLDLCDFDEEYLKEASTAFCPKCNFKVSLDSLIVKNGIFCVDKSSSKPV